MTGQTNSDMRVYRYTGILQIHVVHHGGALFRSSHPCGGCRVAHLGDLVLHQQRGKCKAWIPKPLPGNDERQREREREREREIERQTDMSSMFFNGV